ncbi:MAG: hypothetical protein NWE99_06625 [Candidatus Bathyarchaeota archaeon]|nr:hypothetical protein [Candidatus Bathyarchaeota archaeon]
MLKLFTRKSRAVKKWRSRAWSIDPKKTNLTIISNQENFGHVPPWVYKKRIASLIVCN